MWKQSLLETVAEVGREETRLAEERGSYHQGLPAITGIVNGGEHKGFTSIYTMLTLA